MLRIRTFAFAAMALLGIGSSLAEAGGWSVGIRLGIPIYPGPCYGCYYRPWYYYRPYPVIVEPAPVIVQPAAVVQPAPVAVPAYQSSSPPPAPEPIAAPRLTPTAATQPATLNQRQLDIKSYLGQLADREPRNRAEAAMQLGRLQAATAIDPLAATLAGDPSPSVREAAARSLGLLGSPKAVPALRRAAQVDPDPTVRHSAQYALEVVEITRGR
jgi:hypothetical protein